MPEEEQRAEEEMTKESMMRDIKEVMSTLPGLCFIKLSTIETKLSIATTMKTNKNLSLIEYISILASYILHTPKVEISWASSSSG